MLKQIMGTLGPLILLHGVVSCQLADGLRRSDTQLLSGDGVQIGRVIKGDEVIISKGAANFRVRMLGIAALDAVIADPYLEKHSKAAVAFLQALKGKPLQIFFESRERDAAGRFLGYLQTPDADVNQQMVDAGLVSVYTEYAFAREMPYLEAEASARQSGRGMWADAKTKNLMTGLRRQWDALRATHGDKSLADPLLH